MTELEPSYLAEVERRARRFSGAYTGTSGTLAGDCIHLLKELRRMEATAIKLEQANKILRQAVQDRIENGGAAAAATDCASGLCENEETECNERYILDAADELKAESETRLPGDSLLSENQRGGSPAVLEILDRAARLHSRKTLDYGSQVDPLYNIRQAAKLVNVPPWKVCLIRMADKLTRMESFCRRGEVEFDGVEDTLLDLIVYAAMAEAFYEEGTP